MEVLNVLKRAVKACADVIRRGAAMNGDDLKYFNIFWHGYKMPFAEE